ncbi:MAG: hypothetical protein M1819_001830 [Sarea resinae]|nr:MAG: hypothetical protein M1819_001830 [Sarea resinae]
MFALRTTALRASTARAPLAARSFASAALRMQEKVAEKQVPVSSYHSEKAPAQGAKNPVETVLPVGEAKPVAFGADDTRAAVPLGKGVIDTLTPTLKKFTLQGKVAVITGGARGLGYGMAQAMSEVGAKAIAILDIQQEIGDKAAADLHAQTGIPVQFYKVDVRDGGAIAEVVDNIVSTFGSVDVLVNSAGIADSNIKAEVYDHAMFRRLIDINITGSFLVAQAVGRAMIQQGRGGAIVNIASMSGTVVNYPQEQSCYNASKAGVIQLTKSLAAEWAKYKIRVNSISPGYMDTALNRVPALDAQKKIWTSLTPQERLGDPDELNGLATYLASDASSFMTGSNCIIDVSWMHFRRRLDFCG